MKYLLIIISFIGLILTFSPSLLVFYGVIPIKTHYILMFIGTIMWFGTAPFWMKSKKLDDSE